MCAPWGALREIGGRSSVIGRVCAAMCARWRGRRCVVGRSFGSAAVLTAAQAPRLRGAARKGRGVLNLRRKATCIDSTTRLARPPSLAPRRSREQTPAATPPPEGSASPRRPGRPPSDDRPALGGRARRRRAREAAGTKAQRACRGPPDVGGPTGQPPGPQAVTRRSDARPQAMAPGPHPST